MSTKMIQQLDARIQEAQELLSKIEARASRVKEAIATFKSERKTLEKSATQS